MSLDLTQASKEQNVHQGRQDKIRFRINVHRNLSTTKFLVSYLIIMSPLRRSPSSNSENQISDLSSILRTRV